MREDWTIIPIEKIGDIITGNTPSKSNTSFYSNKDFPFYKPKDLEAGDNVKFSNDGLSEEGFKNSRIAPEGSILVTCIGATIGKTGLIKKTGAFNQQINGIVPFRNIDSKFIYFQIIGLEFQKKIKENASSTTLPILNKSKFSILEINLAPLPIQRAIVRKIENLFVSLDKGIADLKTAQEQLKVYRQAVLKKAFEGVVTETTLEDIMESAVIGLVRSNAEQNNDGIGVPYVKMNNIDLEGNVNLSDLVFINANKVERDKYSLINGDILLNTRNSYELVGKTGIVKFLNFTCLFNNNIMRIRLKTRFNPSFICYQLISPFVKNQMGNHKKATTNVCALYQRNIFPLIVKIAGETEQHAIVSEIESRLSVCDKVEQSISEALAKAEALRQSILKKAFEGKLLSEIEIAKCKQEADYEPASKLLERIKKEKHHGK